MIDQLKKQEEKISMKFEELRLKEKELNLKEIDITNKQEQLKNRETNLIEKENNIELGRIEIKKIEKSLQLKQDEQKRKDVDLSLIHI